MRMAVLPDGLWISAYEVVEMLEPSHIIFPQLVVQRIRIIVVLLLVLVEEEIQRGREEEREERACYYASRERDGKGLHHL